tara:strand:+ start:4901 stop:5074 length:174 start_codon:yes stop_codon:yes gene_type:complete
MTDRPRLTVMDGFRFALGIVLAQVFLVVVLVAGIIILALFGLLDPEAAAAWMQEHGR